jgi:hypothetical protein
VYKRLTLRSLHQRILQLHLRYTNYTTPQLKLHYTTTTTTAALHHATSVVGEVTDQATTATIATTQKHTSTRNYLSVHQWIRSAIRDAQQRSSRIGLKLPPPPCAVLLVEENDP